MIETCDRCGWKWDAMAVAPSHIEDWPPDVPEPPPLPAIANPHPSGGCPCHLSIGQEVFWDLGESCPDLPPVRAVFFRMESFEGPEFMLRNNEWVMMSEPVGKAIIEIDKNSVHPDILRDFPNLLEPEFHVVFLEDLTDTKRWPIIKPKE